MTQLKSKKWGARAALCLVAIQLLLCPTAIGGSDDGSPSGAEFLKNVIGNLRKPNRRVVVDRIDVEEHIPDDVPYPSQPIGVQIAPNQPDPNNQINRPGDNDVESVLAQILPQFFKNSLPDTQAKVVNSQGSVGPQQFGPIMSNSLDSTGPQQFNPSSGNNMQIPQNLMDALTGSSPKPDGSIAGYNYFFVPLDNNQLQQQLQNGNGLQAQQQQQAAGGGGGGGQNSESAVATNPENGMTKPKVEPLFVAMAGFVGVAVVFLSAMMFIPRLPFPILSSKAALKRAPEELASLTRLVAESIDGKDCSERIACEVGRAMRSMQVGSKPIRMMEIILPPDIAKQLAQVRRSASRKEQCHFIMCKKTEGTLKMVAKLKKNNHKTVQDVREIFNMETNNSNRL